MTEFNWSLQNRTPPPNNKNSKEIRTQKMANIIQSTSVIRDPNFAPWNFAQFVNNMHLLIMRTCAEFKENHNSEQTHFLIYRFDASSVTVIVLGEGIGNLSSIPVRGSLCFGSC